MSAALKERALNPIVTLLLRRTVHLVTVAAAVSVVTFGLIHLVPGDPAETILGTKANPENLRALRAELGVDQSLWEQARSFFADLLHGNLGHSITEPRSVSDMIVPAFGVTLCVVAVAIAVSTVLGVGLGLAAALAKRRGVDVGIRAVGMVLLATPTFLLGLLLILVAAIHLAWLPAGGWGGTPEQRLRSVVLPALALAGMMTPLVTRAVRQAAREAMAQPYVAAATSRGLPHRLVILRHVLPNSLLPVITVIGYSAAAVVGGSAVVEAVFALPGIGSLLVTAVASRDYPVIQGVALAIAIFVVIVNFATDVIHALVDPRTRVA